MGAVERAVDAIKHKLLVPSGGGGGEAEARGGAGGGNAEPGLVDCHGSFALSVGLSFIQATNAMDVDACVAGRHCVLSAHHLYPGLEL